MRIVYTNFFLHVVSLFEIREEINTPGASDKTLHTPP